MYDNVNGIITNVIGFVHANSYIGVKTPSTGIHPYEKPYSTGC